MKPIQKKIVTVVLTGGPCGGKTSSLQRLKDIFTNIGWNVYVVPEIPTIFILGGASYPGDHPSQKVKLLAFEKSIMQTQLQLEDAMRHVAGELIFSPSNIFIDKMASRCKLQQLYHHLR